MSTDTVGSADADPVNRSQRTGTRLPLVVYVLALGTFLMLTTEFVVAGILPEVAGDLQVSLAHAGSLITVFAMGMIVGAPLMALLTMRVSKRVVLTSAMVVFIVGHVVVAMSSDMTVLLAARFVTALATGAFWAVAAVVASRAAGPGAGAKALGIVNAGGSLATVLGVPVGAFVAQVAGWRGTFWLLAGAGVVAAYFIMTLVPSGGSESASTLKAQFDGLRSKRLWLVLAACATTSGGVLATYTYISPILTDQALVPAVLVPVVLTGYGVGSFIGTVLGGRLGDAHPGAVTIVVPAVTVVALAAIALLSGLPWVTVLLVVVVGFFGLSANGVLIHLAVQASGTAATLGSALAVSAFNVGTAVGTAVAGAALATSLGTRGPAAVGAAVVALTLIPAVLLTVARRRASTDC